MCNIPDLTYALKEISATVLEFRWTSRGVATDRRKLNLLYHALLGPLWRDFIVFMLQPLGVSLIAYQVALHLQLTGWVTEIWRRPIGALLMLKLAVKGCMLGWREVRSLHSTVWQSRYVISTILCNTDSSRGDDSD
eukprot:Protomagalhaensia_sp_Gyna_25__3564@NODE_3203_length_681_cov_4_389408_g334_i3_p1_GENE_NODE_3203_length_681_cov_4_389408_g334_i3NODE_3203_length_681_cov_4_389408_g334_i3_p1_ORF_typecomplete_len136_score7_27_NODE_3203_length_681_cov_4_389408_g334_i321428